MLELVLLRFLEDQGAALADGVDAAQVSRRVKGGIGSSRERDVGERDGGRP